MKPPKDIVGFVKDASIRTTEAANARVVQRMQDAYEGAAAGQVAGLRGRLARWAVAAAVLIVGGILVGQLARLGGGSVAWAEVSRRFQAVPFFSATIYMKDDATAEPTQMELWMSHDGHIRLRMGKQVIFAHSGWVKAYDIGSRQSVEPDEMAGLFIEKIGQAKEFSLEAIIDVMFGGQASEITPLINPDAVISQDVVVFDVELPSTPEWVRIWALRESRLPVRITVWDPRDGASTDAIFSYSREQRAEFFDPNAFEKQLGSPSSASRVSVAYAFLKDPGGRNITPEEMFKESGYHMPEIEQVGITPDGAVWVIAAKGRNRTPSGHSFFGFGKLEDDLGRRYRRAYSSHRTATDQSMEVLVPADYPFDRRTPARLVFTCRDEHGPRGEPVIVGSRELTQWQQDQPWPEGTIYDSEHEIMLREAFGYCESRDFDNCRRIVEIIRAGPERARLEHRIDRLRLRMLIRQHKHDEAAQLARALFPEEMQEYVHSEQWREPYEFVDLIVAIAAGGQVDEAHDLWEQAKAARPDVSRWPKYAADDFHRKLPDAIRRAESGIVREMARIPLSDDAIGGVIGCDVATDERYVSLIAREKSQEIHAATRQAAEQRLRELAQYYGSHPLPDRAELLERPDEQNIYLVGTGNDLPGHEGYKILPINTSISGIVSVLKRFGGEDDGEATLVHPYKAAIRFAEGLEDRELRADLVYKGEIELAERFILVLASLGMEVTHETRPTQTILVAQHDGRRLRNHLEVYGPWHMDNGGPGVRMWHVADLLEHLSQQMQTGVLLLDQTNIEEPVCVGTGTPNWEGAEGIAQARRWLQEQFGITLAQDTRAITTYLVQRKTQ